jgi:cytochrome c oxidase assembly protein subunit 15
MESAVKRLAVAATIGMFLVLIMGATVTNTGSGEGCGRSWPLCHGAFIPSYAFTTAIEFSHRLVTGLEGLLIAAVAAGALLRRRGNREVKLYVGLMVGTLFLQSGLGASAVLWPQSAFIMAMHFGISLVCFASVFLLTRLLYQSSHATAVGFRAATTALPGWYRAATWGALIAAIGVAYLGAYMRHSDATLACYRWPSCTDEVLPGFDGAVGVAMSHRLAALAEILLVGTLAAFSYHRRTAEPDLFRVNAAAFVLILLQAAAGGAVVLTRLDLWSPLAHAGLMALLFLCLADACRQVATRRKAEGGVPSGSRKAAAVGRMSQISGSMTGSEAWSLEPEAGQ